VLHYVDYILDVFCCALDDFRGGLACKKASSLLAHLGASPRETRTHAGMNHPVQVFRLPFLEPAKHGLYIIVCGSDVDAIPTLEGATCLEF
jgi:hypothetical protein